MVLRDELCVCQPAHRELCVFLRFFSGERDGNKVMTKQVRPALPKPIICMGAFKTPFSCLGGRARISLGPGNFVFHKQAGYMPAVSTCFDQLFPVLFQRRFMK